jgi:transketolase
MTRAVAHLQRRLGHLQIPFINSFAVFVVGRAYDQIRQAICIPKLNVKIVGSSAGLSDFGDGATHQSVEDVALMRSLPNMTVISPCDALEEGRAVRAIADYLGPVYLRLSRSEMPVVTAEGDSHDRPVEQADRRG